MVHIPVPGAVGDVEGDVVDAGQIELELRLGSVEHNGLALVLEGPGVVDDAHRVVAPPSVKLDRGVLVLGLVRIRKWDKRRSRTRTARFASLRTRTRTSEEGNKMPSSLG